VKLSRYLTHLKQLKPDDEFNNSLAGFYGRCSLLKTKLGVILVQLAASTHCNIEKIQNIIEQTKKAESKYKLKLPLAIEFRHQSWFNTETFNLLKKNNIAFVINDNPPDKWPMLKLVTANFTYIRLHGHEQLYASKYSDKQLLEWANYIKGLNLEKVFVYFNNDSSAFATKNAEYLKQNLVENLVD
jgi:uncharacterized protein YecE (DUF72 family)